MGETPTEGNEGNEEDWEPSQCGMQKPERESGQPKLINSARRDGTPNCGA